MNQDSTDLKSTASTGQVERGVIRKLTIAECLRAEMIEAGEKRVWAGKPDLCISAYIRSGGKVTHPLDRIKSVIDAARRSRFFKQEGYIRASDAKGRREVLHPAFVLDDETYNAELTGRDYGD